MQKDSTGHIGFVFKENKITNIVKDSSAARNGVLIDHHLVEVNGQNVVGMKVNTLFPDILKAPRHIDLNMRDCIYCCTSLLECSGYEAIYLALFARYLL
jgi:syntenin-1